MSQEISPIADADSAESHAAMLLIQPDGAAVSQRPLSNHVMTIGRDSRNDLVLDTELVSRIHARLEYEQGYWHIVDLGSTNGTFLNGQKLEAYSPQLINCADQLNVGNFQLTLASTKGESPDSGTVTLLLPKDNHNPPSVVDEISLARQLFGTVNNTLTEVQAALAATAYNEDDTTLFKTLIPSLSSEEQKPRDVFQFSIWPKVLVQSGQVMVSILNESSRVHQVTVEVLDVEGVRCDVGKVSAEIPPGSEYRTALNLQATTRPFVGEPQKYPFSVVVCRDSAEQQTAQGHIQVEPRFSTTMLIFLTGFITLLVIAWLINLLL
ncbi:MAG TPA: FHA domain-containing protein [Anaerolineae bacterium]|nr:FHA domain-containing protein [Anaerolineae bacterium]